MEPHAYSMAMKSSRQSSMSRIPARQTSTASAMIVAPTIQALATASWEARGCCSMNVMAALAVLSVAWSAISRCWPASTRRRLRLLSVFITKKPRLNQRLTLCNTLHMTRSPSWCSRKQEIMTKGTSENGIRCY
ncbi:uncharacterized protein BDZ99DRAFT_208768 [Mytilinidion resinicola]|uniref:Uncharacterized protein n=1 Tax=Mytilinidion resinicola TaxID=574789 RepID=A0A6A6Y1F6_9PEZI|nr:uncharacterized protein BDZ99DRAFT_208768 [Mytilinidion resinicola]KAF2802065.1 hypothetical protein BDZ99DRAFT_208768 [Mytilinidion resinicola]